MRIVPKLIMTAYVLSAACSAAQAYTAKTIYSFCHDGNCTDGETPLDVIVDSAGTLYGVANHGAQFNGGAVFALVPNAKRTKWTYKQIWNFCNPDDCKEGWSPNTGLIVDTAGNLYGTTENQGEGGFGELYRLSRAGKTWKLDVLYNFCALADCTDNAPTMRLTYAGATSGALYDGTSPLYAASYLPGFGQGAGAVVAISPSAGNGLWTGRLVYDFCQKTNCVDGANVEALTADEAGNLFGTTANGGKQNAGTVFELAPDGAGGWTHTVLHNFCASCTTGGRIPIGQIQLDAGGTIYGALMGGDSSGNGGLFALSLKSGKWKEKPLYSFCPQGDCSSSGAATASGVVRDSQGNLFGANAWFGAFGGGAVFAMDPKFHALYEFCGCGGDGRSPASIALDAAGNIYGTTVFGGNASMGTVFEIKKDN